MAREAADCQRPRVSRERGPQILEATVDSIRQQIEADYPQLAAQGINGWESFKAAFSRTSAAAQQEDMASSGRGRDLKRWNAAVAVRRPHQLPLALVSAYKESSWSAYIFWQKRLEFQPNNSRRVSAEPMLKKHVMMPTQRVGSSSRLHTRFLFCHQAAPDESEE